jgi:hypothetical protein
MIEAEQQQQNAPNRQGNIQADTQMGTASTGACDAASTHSDSDSDGAQEVAETGESADSRLRLLETTDRLHRAHGGG